MTEEGHQQFPRDREAQLGQRWPASGSVETSLVSSAFPTPSRLSQRDWPSRFTKAHDVVSADLNTISDRHVAITREEIDQHAIEHSWFLEIEGVSGTFNRRQPCAANSLSGLPTDV